MTDLKYHFLQQGFPCLTEFFSVVVSCTQPDQRSGNSWLAGWYQMLAPLHVPAKAPRTIHSIEKPAHFHLQPALFIFLSELVTINIIKSHKSRWCGLELPAVLPLVNCLSCPVAWLPQKAYHQFPVVSLHFFTSHPSPTHPEIFSTFTVDTWDKDEKQIGAENQPQKLRIILTEILTSLISQEPPSFHLWKETTSGVQLIFTNSVLQKTHRKEKQSFSNLSGTYHCKIKKKLVLNANRNWNTAMTCVKRVV